MFNEIAFWKSSALERVPCDKPGRLRCHLSKEPFRLRTQFQRDFRRIRLVGWDFAEPSLNLSSTAPIRITSPSLKVVADFTRARPTRVPFVLLRSSRTALLFALSIRTRA